MKTLALAIASILSLTVLSPSTAKADCGRTSTRVTYDDCGYMLVWEYRYVGRACDGCPIFRWVVVNRVAPPRCEHERPHCGTGYYDGGYRGSCGYSGYSGGRYYSGGYSGYSGGHRH